jgi:hypothetical protein
VAGDESQITLNKDLVCKRHRDHASKKNSGIMRLGDFTGGALNFDDGVKVEGKREWDLITGFILLMSDPREGTKYSIVLCRGTKKQKSRTLIEANRAKREKSPCA